MGQRLDLCPRHLYVRVLIIHDDTRTTLTAFLPTIQIITDDDTISFDTDSTDRMYVQFTPGLLFHRVQTPHPWTVHESTLPSMDYLWMSRDTCTTYSGTIPPTYCGTIPLYSDRYPWTVCPWIFPQCSDPIHRLFVDVSPEIRVYNACLLQLQFHCVQTHERHVITNLRIVFASIEFVMIMIMCHIKNAGLYLYTIHYMYMSTYMYGKYLEVDNDGECSRRC